MKQKNDNFPKTHGFCAYYKEKTLHFAWIESIEQHKFTVVNEAETRFYFLEQRIFYYWLDNTFSAYTPAWEYLNEKIQQLEQLKADLHIPTLHSLCEIGRVYSLQELAEISLTDIHNHWEKMALYENLNEDFLYFKKSKRLYTPQNEDNMQVLLQQKKKEQENEQVALQEKQWAKDLIAHKKCVIQPPQKKLWEDFRQKCFQFLHNPHTAKEKLYKNYFNLHNLNEIAFQRTYIQYLQKMGFQYSWLQFKMEELPVSHIYPEQVTQDALSLLDTNIDHSHVCDEQYLQCFTVDNLKTTDFDDAISLQQQGEHYFVRIHITAAALYVTPKTALFQFMKQQVVSFYSPSDTYHLIPPQLSENFLALKSGSPKIVLTYQWKIDTHLAVIEKKWYLSKIKIQKNLTYDTVDTLIENEDPYWKLLLDFALTYQKQRCDNGAIIKPQTECTPYISDNGKILLEQRNQSSPAHTIISEMALLTNSFTGEICHLNNIPAFYRNQAEYKKNQTNNNNDTQNLPYFSIPASTLSTIGGKHCSLGIKHYAQATSPLRRVTDLCIQYNLIAFLKQNTEFHHTTFNHEFAEYSIQKMKQFRTTERQINNVYKIKFLAQNCDKHYTVTIIRHYKNITTARFLDIDLLTEIQGDNLTPHNTVIVKITYINPITCEIRVKKIATHKPSSDG